MLQRVIAWFKSRKRKPLNELLRVDWDDEFIRVKVIEELEDAFNQEFRWSEIVKVCFKDEGIYNSDLLFIEVVGRSKPFVVPTEALNGNEFFGLLHERGYFPAEVMTKAIRSTDGGTYCWPVSE